MGLLQWALTALLLALVAGIFGVSDLARGLRQFARVLFGLFLTISLVMLVLVVLGVGMMDTP